MYMSRAPVLVGKPKASYLHLCASVTKQCNFVLAKGVDLIGWKSNRSPGGK